MMIENVIKTGFPTVVNHHNHKRSLGTQSYMCTQTMRLIGPVARLLFSHFYMGMEIVPLL